ncbi:J domain-containing protein [Nocardioides coralli]|uniref:J domain-containing protein n=1 Tax=Nocardioides coralli TaxID=2872154 RepID=UPI001CA42D19|nr:J domain-containing protein [Nocardioides coralli]QZY29543.1 J domain-containing protein [Nocardioides coralli]
MTSGPNYYDVLDVDPGASSEEIRDAWRAAIADLTPADRRFRLYNQAAEVLLDDERRAAYDAQLAAEVADRPEATQDADEAGATVPAEPAAPAAAAPAAATGPVAERPTPAWRDRPVPTWLLVAVALLAVLSVGLMSYLFTQPSEASVEEAAASARSAAEEAIVPVLSYDYRTLEEDQAAAHAFLTDDYRQEYDRFMEDVVTANAERTEAAVEVEVVTSAVVRASADRAEVLLFVNRPTTNAETEEPKVFKDQVRVRLEKVDGEWLVDCLITAPDGSCGS